jgi:hypothetical protein
MFELKTRFWTEYPLCSQMKEAFNLQSPAMARPLAAGAAASTAHPCCPDEGRLAAWIRDRRGCPGPPFRTVDRACKGAGRLTGAAMCRRVASRKRATREQGYPAYAPGSERQARRGRA